MAKDMSFPVRSEEIEPTAAILVGRLFARCEVARGDPLRMERACRDLWFLLDGLNKVAIAVRTATHFSVAMNNHYLMVNTYVERHLGVSPIHDKW